MQEQENPMTNPAIDEFIQESYADAHETISRYMVFNAQMPVHLPDEGHAAYARALVEARMKVLINAAHAQLEALDDPEHSFIKYTPEDDQ